jgi:hypothetical protein
MKLSLLFPMALTAAAAAANGPEVPAEFLGTWASAPADCTAKGRSTLSISETTVDQHDAHGHIFAGSSPGNREIQVIFDTQSGGASARNVRTYTLSTDGRSLLELRGGQVVASRTKCEEAKK